MSKSITYEVTVDQCGTKRWKLNGKLHREDGPAIELPNGTKHWCINGKLHREDGPAIEWVSGTKEWYSKGQLHREDGPAYERADGYKEWYINGDELTKKQFKAKTAPQAVEMTIAQIEALVGKRVKIVK